MLVYNSTRGFPVFAGSNFQKRQLNNVLPRIECRLPKVLVLLYFYTWSFHGKICTGTKWLGLRGALNELKCNTCRCFQIFSGLGCGFKPTICEFFCACLCCFFYALAAKLQFCLASKWPGQIRQVTVPCSERVLGFQNWGLPDPGKNVAQDLLTRMHLGKTASQWK